MQTGGGFSFFLPPSSPHLHPPRSPCGQDGMFSSILCGLEALTLTQRAIRHSLARNLAHLVLRFSLCWHAICINLWGPLLMRGATNSRKNELWILQYHYRKAGADCSRLSVYAASIRSAAILAYSGESSMPMHFLPVAFAASAVLPPPRKGSSTVPPSGTMPMSSAMSGIGLLVRWTFSALFTGYLKTPGRHCRV